MNVIFVTIAYPRTSAESNLYTDLMEEFAEHGHKVYVVCPIEKRFSQGTYLDKSNSVCMDFKPSEVVESHGRQILLVFKH